MSEKLAVHGGKPVRTKPWPKWPVFTRKDREDLAAVLDDGRLTAITGPKVKEFEEKFARKFGMKYALATCNGVTALHLALAALDIGPSDEVIVPAHTFIGTAIPVLMANAVPVFVDIDIETFNIDAGKIEAAVTDRTGAVIPVHLNGLCADMDEILRIAKKRKLAVVEDACQAHGGSYKGKLAGTIGEGGMLVMNDPDFYDKARCFRSYGEELIDKIGERKYEHVALGFNYRMGAMNAVIGINQLDRLEAMVEKRNKNASYLRKKLSEVPGVIPPKDYPNRVSAFYKFVCRMDLKRIKTDLMPFIDAVKAEGIPVTPRYPKPLPLQKVFREKMGYGKTDCPYGCDKYGRTPAFLTGSWPQAERVGKEAFVVQVHPTIEERDFDDAAEAIAKVADHFR